MNDIQISPFTIDCHAAVLELWRQSEGVAVSDADSWENIATYLARNPGMSFVARMNDRIVGAVLGGHDGRRGLIHHLAVHQEARRMGVGRRLVEASVAALKAAGMQRCLLFVFTENKQGQAFWRALGWTRHDDVSIMSLDLRPRVKAAEQT